MKAKVYRNIVGSDIIKRVSPPLKGQVALRQFEKTQHTYTLAVFPSQRKDVVPSGAVNHVLVDIPKSERLVAVAGCFTLEALASLKNGTRRSSCSRTNPGLMQAGRTYEWSLDLQ